MKYDTLSTADARQALGKLGRTKLFQLLATGELTRVKCGRKTLVTIDSIDTYVEANKNKG